MKTIAVIPCYNEVDHIAQVVKSALPYVSRAIVVDNNCSDHTAEVAELSGAKVIPCFIKGVGAATRAGIHQALVDGAEVIITLDGDGQHYPPDIPVIVDKLYLDLADVVVGIRDFNGSMPKYRKLGNEIINAAFNIGSHVTLPDSQCGLRAFTSEVAYSINLQDNGFGCITEFLCKVRKAHLRILPMPVHCLYHQELNNNSTLNPVKHGVLALSRTLRWRLWEVTGK